MHEERSWPYIVSLAGVLAAAVVLGMPGEEGNAAEFPSPGIESCRAAWEVRLNGIPPIGDPRPMQFDLPGFPPADQVDTTLLCQSYGLPLR